MSGGRGIGEVLTSLGDLRATALSLRVTRGDVGMEDELGLFMQLSVSPQVVAKLDAVDHAIVLEVM